MICGVLAGVCLLRTARAAPTAQRIFWLVAAALVQLRLLANLLDGMVAIESGTASPLGELFNEAPDRISDATTLIGLGYAAGGNEVLGWCAALLGVMTAYVRTLCKSAGAPSDFRGPMAKQQRMFLVTAVCVFNALAPRAMWHWSLAGYCLGIISLGCLVTICRRLGRSARILRSKA